MVPRLGLTHDDAVCPGKRVGSRFSVCMGICTPIDRFLVRNANLANICSLITFATRNQSSLAVTFQGWSVTVHPVRSTVVAPPRN